jgi:hypothetical protein
VNWEAVFFVFGVGTGALLELRSRVIFSQLGSIAIIAIYRPTPSNRTVNHALQQAVGYLLATHRCERAKPLKTKNQIQRRNIARCYDPPLFKPKGRDFHRPQTGV